MYFSWQLVSSMFCTPTRSLGNSQLLPEECSQLCCVVAWWCSCTLHWRSSPWLYMFKCLLMLPDRLLTGSLVIHHDCHCPADHHPLLPVKTSPRLLNPFFFFFTSFVCRVVRCSTVRVCDCISWAFSILIYSTTSSCVFFSRYFVVDDVCFVEKTVEFVVVFFILWAFCGFVLLSSFYHRLRNYT